MNPYGVFILIKRFVARRGEKRGFTLVELLTVVAITGLLASIFLVDLKEVPGKARLVKVKQFSAQISHALGAYAVGLWRLEDPSGNTRDSSGYGSNGTVGVSVVRHPACDLSFGGCFELDGTVSGSIRVPAYYSKREFFPTGWGGYSGPITITAWAKPTTIDSQNRFIFSDTGGDKEGFVRLRTNELRYAWDWQGIVPDVIIPVSLGLNQWHFFALVVERPGGATSTLKAYLNGDLMGESSGNCTGSCGPDEDLLIGSRFIGLIDEIAVYNHALTIGEIKKLYAQSTRTHLSLNELMSL